MPRYTTIIAVTRALLNAPANNEWIDRYNNYAKILLAAVPRITEQRGKFRIPSPFHTYLNLTNVKGAVIKFQLRYLGQNVADLRYDSANDTMLLSTAGYVKQNNANFSYDGNFTMKSWLDSDAKEFRAYFKCINEWGIARINGGKRNDEHRLESALYTEFEKGMAASKAFGGIQPVQFGNVRMGFPTPLRASKHGAPEYCGSRGGSVDILVRWGIPKSTLCVIELKDENNKGSETPEDVVEQATVYAVFLRELLRSSCGEEWWRLFGFSRQLPKKLHINAMSLMPYGLCSDHSFCGKDYPISGDCIQLHASYFMERIHFQFPFVR